MLDSMNVYMSGTAAIAALTCLCQQPRTSSRAPPRRGRRRASCVRSPSRSWPFECKASGRPTTSRLRRVRRQIPIWAIFPRCLAAASRPEQPHFFSPHLMHRLLRPVSRALRAQGSASCSRHIARALPAAQTRGFSATGTTRKNKKMTDVDDLFFGAEEAEADEVVAVKATVTPAAGTCRAPSLCSVLIAGRCQGPTRKTSGAGGRRCATQHACSWIH